MAAPAFSRQSPPLLLTIAYLCTLVAVFFGIGAMVWWLWPGSSTTANSFIAAETSDAYISPAKFKRSKNVRLALLEQVTPDQEASRAIQKQLSDLQRYIRNQVTSRASVLPTWIGKSFVGIGIDPSKCDVKSSGVVTEVSRYTRSESAPKFAGNRAFQQFVANTMAPMANCDDFQIDIRLEDLKQTGDEFTATLLAESVGSRDQKNSEWSKSGATKKVFQVSSVWKTTWSNKDASQFELLTAEVPAAEIITLSVSAARLFYECTESIVGKNHCLKDQLVYGVDQWASKLPGIDVEGNSGLSVGDVNGDGLDDIYLCQPQGIANRLLIQKHDGTTFDASQKYGVNLLDESRSSLLVDLDNDGDQDLVVATKFELILMSNTGDQRFVIIEKLDRCCEGLSLSAADFDNDGDVDLFLSRLPRARASAQIADSTANVLAGSVLLRNDESFQFVDVTASTGLVSDSPLSARSAIWFDRDLDGDQDLYVAGGKSGGVQFVNTDGFFNRASEMVASSLSSQQSASTGDFNGDGRFDLLVASKSEFGGVSGNESHISFGGQEDSTKPFFLRAPLFDNQHATSSLVADLNNDGRDDLVIGNGGYTRIALDDLSWFFPRPTADSSDQLQASDTDDDFNKFFDDAKLEHCSIFSRQKNCCYAGIGANGFAEISAASGLNYPDDSRAMAATDWDHDGDVDVLVVNRTGPQLRIFINVLNRRNSVSFRLKGETSNCDAIGTRVEIKLRGVPAPLVKTVQAGGGFLSQSSKRLTFGVGEAKVVDSVVVRWPSGKVHRFEQLAVGAMYELAEGDVEPVERVNNRFRLNIQGSRLSGSIRPPTPDERTLFVPRFPLPTPEAQVASGRWNLLKPSAEQPTIFLFWGQNSRSEQAIQQLNRFVGELESAKATVVTVFTDTSHLRADERWKYIGEFAADLKKIKNWTALSDGGLESMSIVFGHWFGRRELPESPFALLLDREQKVVGFYPADGFKKNQLLSDLQICDEPPVMADQVSNDDGFWATSTLTVNSRDLSDRLKKAGFDIASKQLDASVFDEVAEDLKNEAKDFAVVGRYDLAQQLFAAALSESPDNISALLGRSNLAIEQALAASRFESKPDDKAADSLAVAVSDDGLTLPEAEDGFERVLEIDPNEWRATIGIAKIQLLQDRPDEAVETLSKHYKTNPRVEVLAMQGRVLFQSGNYREALGVLNKAYDQRSDLPYLAGDLGYIYLLNDEPNEARKYLRKAHELQPSDLTFMRLLAETEFLRGDFSRAVDLFTEVNRRQPEQIHSKNVLAWLLATSPFDEKRDGVAALALIDTNSESLTDQDAATLEIYAACYAEVGQFDKAVRFQQLAVEKSDNDAGSPRYSKLQSKGMLDRLELYRTREPYRTADTSQTPVQSQGSQISNEDYRALRF